MRCGSLLFFSLSDFLHKQSGKFRKLKWLGGEDALSAPQTRLLFENLEKASSSLLYLDVDTCRTDSNSSQALTRILGRLPNLCAFKIYNSSVAACQQILEILMRHCRYRQKWAKFSLAICFIRANRHHRFQDSVVFLLFPASFRPFFSHFNFLLCIVGIGGYNLFIGQ